MIKHFKFMLTQLFCLSQVDSECFFGFTRDMLCPTVQACNGMQGIELNVNRLTFEKTTGSGYYKTSY